MGAEEGVGVGAGLGVVVGVGARDGIGVAIEIGDFDGEGITATGLAGVRFASRFFNLGE